MRLSVAALSGSLCVYVCAGYTCVCFPLDLGRRRRLFYKQKTTNKRPVERELNRVRVICGTTTKRGRVR